jgi:alkanesulfonate monooxygenase SsuD/methylene tetrahydromethanopterin reductase-like flavin-dependent oxidoreductase (luciferase family)
VALPGGTALAGLYLPQIQTDFATIEARARAAEEVGFHSVWFVDHVAPHGGRNLEILEAWTVATAIAMRTERLHVGHLVLCSEFRHPALLAKMAASLDVISGGRFELGLGWGSSPKELADYGFTDATPAVRAARLAETLQMLALLWTGEPVDFDGTYWTLREAVCRPRPVAGRVPIHLGGSGQQLTMPLVGRWADWWNCPSTAIDRLDELRSGAGSARVSVQHPIGLASSSAERDEVVSLVHRRFGGWRGIVAGTPDEVAKVLRQERDAGAELFVCQFHDFGRPETTRLFAEEVLPALS